MGIQQGLPMFVKRTVPHRFSVGDFVSTPDGTAIIDMIVNGKTRTYVVLPWDGTGTKPTRTSRVSHQSGTRKLCWITPRGYLHAQLKPADRPIIKVPTRFIRRTYARV